MNPWIFLGQGDGSDAAAAAAAGGIAMFQLVIGLVAYIVMAVALMTIANKTNTPNGWMAWIPIANLVLMCQIAELELWWILIAIVTCGLATIYFWMRIAERRGKPSWVGILTIVPCIGFFVPLYIAFSD